MSDILLSTVRDMVLKEVMTGALKGKEAPIRNDINAGMQKQFGNNWDVLPVSGLKIMALVTVMNYTLASQGITPRSIAMFLLDQVEHMGLDAKTTEFLQFIKTNGELSMDKLKEFMLPMGDKSNDAFESLSKLTDKGVNGIKGAAKVFGSSVKSSVHKTSESSANISSSLKNKFKQKQSE